MLLIKNRLVFGVIWGVIKQIFKAIYGLISLFHLQITFFYCILGIFAELIFGIVLKNRVTFVLFHVGVGLTLVYAVAATIAGALGYGGKKKKKERGNVDIVETPNNSVQVNPVYQPAPTAVPETVVPVMPKVERPSYFRVSQNPKYVMAEYSDRYELFYEAQDGLKYIRTDYKSK